MPYTLTEFSSDKARELFGRRLKALLKSNRATRREVADYVGVQESTVGRWAMGRGMPRYMEQFDRLAAFFHVGKPYFLEENFEDAAREQKFIAATFRERALLMSYRAAPEEGKRRIEEVASQYIYLSGGQ